jgi:hypothetical protein
MKYGHFIFERPKESVENPNKMKLTCMQGL